MRRHVPMLIVGGIVLAGSALLTTARAQNSNSGAMPGEGVFVARGDFDVQIAVEGENGARVLDRVTEVSLLRDWTVIQRNEAGKNITLVVPRDALVSLEMID